MYELHIVQNTADTFAVPMVALDVGCQTAIAAKCLMSATGRAAAWQYKQRTGA